MDGNSDVAGNPSACAGSLDEVVSTTGIDISSCSGSNGLYLCFDVAETNPATNPAGSDRDMNSSGATDTWDDDSKVTIVSTVDGLPSVLTQFLRDGDFPAIDTDCDGNADGPAVNSTFTNYCFQIFALGSVLDLDIRFQNMNADGEDFAIDNICLLYTSPSPRDATLSRMPSSA